MLLKINLWRKAGLASLRTKVWACAVVFCALFSGEQLRAQMIYDSTFHYDGINWRWKYLNGLTYSYGDSWTTLSDGRIITAGTEPQQSAGTLHSWRRNGHVDTNWAGTWHAVMDVYPSGIHTEVLRLPGDTMLVLGTDVDISNNINNKLALTRVLPSGAVDGSFGVGGTVRYLAYTDNMNWGSEGGKVAVDADGKIYVSAKMYTFWPSYAVFRLKPNGQRDSTFGENGFAYLPFAICGFEVLGIYPQPDGKVMLGGVYHGQGSVPHFGAARLQANGLPDSTYGVNGSAYAMWNATVTGCLQQPDGKMVVYGSYYGEATAVRFTTAGDWDMSFAAGGMYTWSATANSSDEIKSACLDSLGRVYFYGTYTLPNQWPVHFISRIKNNGSADSSFHQWGHSTFASPVAGLATVRGIRAVGAKRIAIFGYVRDPNWEYKTYIARFTMGPSVELLGKQSLCEGDTAKLWCHTTRPRQWYRNGVLLPDTTKMLHTQQAGTYRAVTSFNGYADTSEAVTVFFNPPPQVQIVQNGASLAASGTGLATYQWLDSAGNPLNLAQPTIVPFASGWYSVRVTNAAGCAATSLPYYFSAPTSVSSVAASETKGWRVFPNPAKTALRWEGAPAGPGRVDLFNALGIRVRSVERNATVMPVNDLPPGQYYLRGGDASIPVTILP